jgi:precorrin-6B methylase 2
VAWPDQLDADARRILLAYRRRTTTETLLHAKLKLDIPADVFSSFAVDKGTRLLLREISKADPSWNRALDLGCGYGPIALALAASGRADQAWAMDRDALAVSYAWRNAHLNDVDNIHPLTEMAWPTHLPQDFDAIITNLPAKAGASVHRHLLLGAAGYLVPGGRVWTVVVNPLAEQIEQILTAGAVDDLRRIDGPEHTVFHYALTSEPEPEEDPYLRAVSTFKWGKVRYQLFCLHGLAEFDTRSWVTNAVLDLIRRRFGGPGKRHLIVAEPGQGHIPLLAWTKMRNLESIDLISRDRIALAASRRNLSTHLQGGQITCHLSYLWRVPAERAGSGSVFIAMAQNKEGYETTLAKLTDLMSRFEGQVVLGCKSAWVQRLEKDLPGAGIAISDRARGKGVSAVLLEAREGRR